jgi:Immunoglobulin-like domain of bacterial spore germination
MNPQNPQNPQNPEPPENPQDLEHRLREALHKEAARINPRERRTEILAMTKQTKQTKQEAQPVEPRRRWLIPAAAAASVALIGAAVWGVSSTGGSQQATPAATTTTAPRQAPTAAPPAVTPSPSAPSGSPSATSNGKVAGATTQATLPAYFVGANMPTGSTFGLYREFVRTAVPAGATKAQKASAAVTVALSAAPFSTATPFLKPWAGTSVTNVTVTPSRITITLSGPGAPGFTAAQTRLAVQQLVWTAQAAVGQGNIPVSFVVANGAAKLFGTYPTAQSYNRPAAALQYEVLAPIWITSPVQDQVFVADLFSDPRQKRMKASGQSCAFEGTTQWQLKRGGTTVKSGFTTASSGCPTRGTWQVELGTIPVGSYIFRMYEVSMEGGQVIAETSRPFTVR